MGGHHALLQQLLVENPQSALHQVTLGHLCLEDCKVKNVASSATERFQPCLEESSSLSTAPLASHFEAPNWKGEDATGH